jgi:hypothetical protein
VPLYQDWKGRLRCTSRGKAVATRSVSAASSPSRASAEIAIERESSGPEAGCQSSTITLPIYVISGPPSLMIGRLVKFASGSGMPLTTEDCQLDIFLFAFQEILPSNRERKCRKRRNQFHLLVSKCTVPLREEERSRRMRTGIYIRTFFRRLCMRWMYMNTGRRRSADI